MAGKILIVDDDDATRGGLTELLQHAGYEPLAFSTFVDARRALASEAPDLLIADLRLDGFNGLQLVALSPRPVPAIVVTGFHDHVLEQEARRLGAEYLVKPVVPSALLKLIEQKLLAGGQVYERTRRWTRKPLRDALPGRIDDQPARVLDISYGGVRFQTERTDVDRLPSSVRLVLPSPPLAIDLDLVWASRYEGDRWLCGAAVTNDGDPQWRSLVDTVA